MLWTGDHSPEFALVPALLMASSRESWERLCTPALFLEPVRCRGSPFQALGGAEPFGGCPCERVIQLEVFQEVGVTIHPGDRLAPLFVGRFGDRTFSYWGLELSGAQLSSLVASARANLARSAEYRDRLRLALPKMVSALPDGHSVDHAAKPNREGAFPRLLLGGDTWAELDAAREMEGPPPLEDDEVEAIEAYLLEEAVGGAKATPGLGDVVRALEALAELL
jgi:hypothetical protein